MAIIRNTKQTKTNQSVEKALQILEIMSKNGDAMRLLDIAQAAGLPASTTLRMVNTLACCNYIYQDPKTQMYSLTFKLVRMGSQIKADQSLLAIAKPYIVMLAQRCRESVTLAVPQNNQIVYIGIEESYVNGVAVMHQIGVSVPFHVAAIGKLILLNYSNDEVAQIFEASDKPMLTPRTIQTYGDLISDLHQIRRRGYALNDEESEVGARCIACPVFDFANSICAGIGISGPTFRMTDDFIRTIVPVLSDTALKVSRELGYKGDMNLQSSE